MLIFGDVTLSGDEGIDLIPSASLQGRVMSILVQGATVSDKADQHGRYSYMSFDIDVEIVGDVEEACEILFNAREQYSDPHGFGVVRVIANGVKVTAYNVEEGILEGIFTLSVKAPLLRISVLLLANGGANTKDNESVLDIYQIELKFVEKAE